MVVTVLVTEEEAAVVVAETARVADASSASGRGGRSALAARRWRKRQNGGLLASKRWKGWRRSGHFLLPGQAFLPVNWKKNLPLRGFIRITSADRRK